MKPATEVKKAITDGKLPDSAVVRDQWPDALRQRPAETAAELRSLPVGRWRSLVTGEALRPDLPTPLPGQTIASRARRPSTPRLVTASGADPSLIDELPPEVRRAFARAETPAKAAAIYARYSGPEGDLMAKTDALSGLAGVQAEVAGDVRDLREEAGRAEMDGAADDDATWAEIVDISRRCGVEPWRTGSPIYPGA